MRFNRERCEIQNTGSVMPASPFSDATKALVGRCEWCGIGEIRISIVKFVVAIPKGGL